MVHGSRKISGKLIGKEQRTMQTGLVIKSVVKKIVQSLIARGSSCLIGKIKIKSWCGGENKEMGRGENLIIH